MKIKDTLNSPFLSFTSSHSPSRITPLSNLIICLRDWSFKHPLLILHHVVLPGLQVHSVGLCCALCSNFSLLQDDSPQQCSALHLQSFGLLRQPQPSRQLPRACSRAHHHHPPQEGRPGHLPDFALRNQVPAFGQQVRSWPLTTGVHSATH